MYRTIHVRVQHVASRPAFAAQRHNGAKWISWAHQKETDNCRIEHPA